MSLIRIVDPLQTKMAFSLRQCARHQRPENKYLLLETHVQGSILITTQKRRRLEIPPPYLQNHLAELMQQASCSSISSRIPQTRKKKGVARELCDTVGDLPLGIATIRGYINQSGSNLAEYTETLKTSSNVWTAGAVGPVSHYEKNLEHVFDIAMKELSEIARGVPTACRARQL
jgi:hypothetical protein